MLEWARKTPEDLHRQRRKAKPLMSASLAGKMRAAIQALEAARKTMPESPHESLDSIHRLAHALKQFDGLQGFPEIINTAIALENVEKETALKLVEKILAYLYALLSEEPQVKPLILVIEDNGVDRLLLEKILTSSGCEVLAAATAEEAERFLGESEVSLILLDVVLPDMDGRNLLLRLREKHGTANIPVFVISAKMSASQPKAECLALGADGCFEKPVDPEALVLAVFAQVRKAKSARSRSAQDEPAGLPDRLAFCKAFERISAQAARSQEPLCLALLQLVAKGVAKAEPIQSISGSAVHRAADVLSEAFSHLRFLARWSESELVVLLQGATTPPVTVELDAALQKLQAEIFETQDGRPFRLSFLAGVSDVTEGMSVGTAISEATQLLFIAQVTDRNVYFPSSKEIPQPPKRILLADDDEKLALLMKHRLEREGFSTVHFRDGESALAAAQEETFDLLILNATLPAMDGFDLLMRLREMPSFQAAPILMLTHLGNEKHIVRAFELGADEYMAKPFSPLELLMRVRHLLRNLKPSESR